MLAQLEYEGMEQNTYVMKTHNVFVGESKETGCVGENFRLEKCKMFMFHEISVILQTHLPVNLLPLKHKPLVELQVTCHRKKQIASTTSNFLPLSYCMNIISARIYVSNNHDNKSLQHRRGSILISAIIGWVLGIP